LGVAPRVFFASGRSLLDERAFRLEAEERGDGGERVCVWAGGSSDKKCEAGTRRSVVGSIVRGACVRVGAKSLGLGEPRTAAAQERSVVRDARRAASWSVWWIVERAVDAGGRLWYDGRGVERLGYGRIEVGADSDCGCTGK
jgi:hypothetical protein